MQSSTVNSLDFRYARLISTLGRSTCSREVLLPISRWSHLFYEIKGDQIDTFPEDFIPQEIPLEKTQLPNPAPQSRSPRFLCSSRLLRNRPDESASRKSLQNAHRLAIRKPATAHPLPHQRLLARTRQR